MPFDPGSAKPIQAAAFDPASAQPIEAQTPEPSFGKKLGNYFSGVQQGLYDVPQSIIGLGAQGLDALGVTESAGPTVKRAFDQANRIANPNIDSAASKTGRLAGEFAATAPVAALKVVKGVGLAGSTLNAAVQGGTSAALTSAASEAPIGEQVGFGAVAGAAGNAVMRGISKVVAPKLSEAVKLLKKEGVPLTTGQHLGGAAARAEEKAMSAPFMGDAISARRNAGIEKLNRVVLSRALKPVGGVLPDNVPVGREAVDYVATKLGERYDKLLPKLTGNLDKRFLTDVDGIYSKVKGSLPDGQVDRLKSVIENQIVTKAFHAGGKLDGPTLKGIESELGRLSAGLRGDASFDNRELGHAIDDVQGALRSMIERNNPAHRGELQKLNEGWSNYRIAARAAASQGAPNGVFTPAHLSAAVKASDKSGGKTRFARGTAKMQDLADAAKDVMTSKTNDSGTTARGAAIALGAGLLSPKIPMALVGGAAAYTKTGQGAINAAMFSRPQGAGAVGNYIDRNALALSPGLGLAASRFGLEE